MTDKQKQRQMLIRNIMKHKVLYLFILPAAIWYLIFCYWPMTGILMAFKNYKFNLGVWGSPWVGLKYFQKFMADSAFWQVFLNTVIISGLKLLCSFPAPIILALLLNELWNGKFKRTIQTVSYLPNFVSWVVVVTILQAFFSPYSGVVNNIRQSAFGAQPIFFLGEQHYFYPLVILSDIWKNVGWGSIIFLSAISGVSQELYEVVYIDGGGRLRCMWHVTIPAILPTIAIMFIFAAGGILSAGYDQILLLQQPGNLNVSEIIDTYVLKQGIAHGNFAYATAVGLFKSVFAFMLMYAVNFTSRKLSEVSLW